MSSWRISSDFGLAIKRWVICGFNVCILWALFVDKMNIIFISKTVYTVLVLFFKLLNEMCDDSLLIKKIFEIMI